MASPPSPLIEVRGRSVSIDGDPLEGTRRLSIGVWQVAVSPPVDFSKGNPGTQVVVEGRGTFYLKRKGKHDYHIREDGQVQRVRAE